MWSALKADFQEFVSTVTEDTSNVLSKLDAGMDKDEDQDGAMEREQEDEEAAELEQDAAVDEKNNNKTKMAKRVDHRELQEIMTMLRDHPGTYTEPMTDEEDTEAVEEYLTQFSIESKTDEIALVLNEHQDTVKKHFEELCPTQVSYADFWTRYFYRCDQDRIALQLVEETEHERQKRAEAFEAGVKSVTNFLGGAVAAVASTIAPEPRDSADHGKAGPGTSASINFFGAKGRPPFVMNTAVDESGDDDDAQDEDEEEELGWGDDDEDEEDLGFDQDTPRAARTTEQIEFTDKVLEDLKEKLKQAIEERDQMQQTVQLQAEEISSLRSKVVGDNPEPVNSSELDKMKLALFERDAEIAALKARNHDESLEGAKGAEMEHSSENMIDDLKQQIQQLTQSLLSKEAALKDSNNKLDIVSQELESTRLQLLTNQSNEKDARTTIQELEGKFNDAQVQLESLREELQKQQSAQSSQCDMTDKLSVLRKDLSASENHVVSLTSQLKAAQEKLQEYEAVINQNDADLALTKKASSPQSPDSYSTGVQVETPAFKTPMTAEARLESQDGEGEDGWGDDWSS